MTDATITKTIFLPAPRETVWSFLTESDKLARRGFTVRPGPGRWPGLRAAGKGPTTGSTRGVCWGTVLQMDAPSKLVYSFTIGPLTVP